MGFAPLHVHTHYSLSKAVAKPTALAAAAADFGYGAVAMTDYANLGCAVDFVTAMSEKGIKPILGCEISLCREDPTVHHPRNCKPYSRCVLLAKNLAGWRQLLRAVSRSASKEYTCDGPRLSLESLRDFTGDRNLIAITGYMGSDVADALFECPKQAYPQKSYDRVKAMVKGIADRTHGWRQSIDGIAEQYISIFGHENVFLSAEILDPDDLPATRLVAGAVRDLGKRFRLPVVATPNTHYLKATPQDANDQHVMLLSGLKTSWKGRPERVRRELDNTIETFFGRDNYPFHFPSEDEMLVHHSREEVDRTLRVVEMCEEYSIITSPKLPNFPCPDGMNSETYLRELCEKGFADKVEGRVLPRPTDEYRSRLEMELGVINGAGLPGYFLIVQDFMNYGRQKNWILGPGRGSGAGCIISWLTGITGIDPLEYGLIFERFFNAGRANSFPDIDCDIPKYKREEVYNYMQGKYGTDYVAKIATFNSMQGRSALTAVMSVRDKQFDIIKQITKSIPDKARIAEELEEMRLSGEEPSVLGYSLDFLQDDLSEWVQVEEMEQGGRVLHGDYAKEFEQAIRLEGTKTHIGMHAAGVAIGAEPLADVCPMKWDAKHRCNVVAMDWQAVEKLGVPKFDVLAVAVLDKAQAVRSLVRTGRIMEN